MWFSGESDFSSLPEDELGFQGWAAGWGVSEWMFNVPVYVQAALLETWKCSIMQYASIRCKTINDNQHFLELEYSCALCRFNHKRAEKHLNKQHVARLYSSGILFFFPVFGRSWCLFYVLCFGSWWAATLYDWWHTKKNKKKTRTAQLSWFQPCAEMMARKTAHFYQSTTGHNSPKHPFPSNYLGEFIDSLVSHLVLQCTRRQKKIKK